MISIKARPSRNFLVYFKRHMSQLTRKPKSSSFTSSLAPDGKIPSEIIAMKNENKIINTPRILASGNFSWTFPEQRKGYKYLSSSEPALEDLGLSQEEIEDEDYRKIVSGEYYNENKDKFRQLGFPFPYSQAYAGWQFGQFAGQLGDGRVVNLFEVPKNKSDKNNRPFFEIQLKGAGMTPYSRFADGKAVLRSSIREYIISEHLNAIGIPTTRALALTYLPKTYAQRHWAEKCAIVARFAESWVRLGNFDLFRWRGDRKGIRELSDYVINQLFTFNGCSFVYLEKYLDRKKSTKDILEHTLGELSSYDKMYYETIIRNAETTAMWQAYGFLNGVLNTDNTSILGLSIDFGPFSIMDKFDPDYTPNSEDHELRYGYRNTPSAIWWNLTRLGEDLAELIGEGPNGLSSNDDLSSSSESQDKIIKRATKVIELGGEIYQDAFTLKYVSTLFKRLGLDEKKVNSDDPEETFLNFINPLLEILRKSECDYNKFFLQFQALDVEQDSIPREVVEKLLTAKFDEDLSKYSKKEIFEDFHNWFRAYKGINANMRTSSRSRSDNSFSNPLFLPRNWILDEVIEFTEKNNGEDLTYLRKLEKMSFYPFEKSKWGDDLKELEERWLIQGDIGEDLSMLQCSCSS